jgi:hypothetical protein
MLEWPAFAMTAIGLAAEAASFVDRGVPQVMERADVPPDASGPQGGAQPSANGSGRYTPPVFGLQNTRSSSPWKGVRLRGCRNLGFYGHCGL